MEINSNYLLIFKRNYTQASLEIELNNGSKVTEELFAQNNPLIMSIVFFFCQLLFRRLIEDFFPFLFFFPLMLQSFTQHGKESTKMPRMLLLL